jgi:hypothetical protein
MASKLVVVRVEYLDSQQVDETAEVTAEMRVEPLVYLTVAY